MKFPDAHNRIGVEAPQRPLTLLEENRIRVKINLPGLISLRGGQTKVSADGTSGDEVAGSFQQMPILTDTDANQYVVVVPRYLGKTRFEFVGDYPDNGFVHESFIADVEPSHREASALVVGSTGSPDTEVQPIRAYLTPYGARGLDVNASYDGVEGLTQVDARFVQFKIRAISDEPIIKIDSTTGKITPIRAGHALVLSSFGGVTHITCVVVEERDLVNFDHSRCRELLRPGESLGDLKPQH